MSDAADVNHEIEGKRRSGRADLAVAAIAARQHGVVSRAQLARLGLGRGAVEHRIACGRLHPVYRGVYAVGHSLLSVNGRRLAGVLAAGPGAALSHHSAAALWGIRRGEASSTEITVPRWRRPRPGLSLHVAAFPADEVTIRHCIRVTSVPRTLLDLAAILRSSDVERAIERAEALRLCDPLSLADLVSRYPRRPNVATTRAILAANRIGSAITRSELEDRFLALLADHGLPRPTVNALVETSAGRWIEVDCVWPDARLAVELDGYAIHAPRASFERDRGRDRALAAAGWRVVRITWRQIHLDARTVVGDLESLLATGSPGYPSPP
ncbi:MAG: type IV toxin-antitoxin system AbiEi family antitoxin domain-containing protein [Solirubrobacteraceae bacterium]